MLDMKLVKVVFASANKSVKVAFALVTLLSTGASAQTTISGVVPAVNTIADGGASGPRAYGLPLDVTFPVSGFSGTPSEVSVSFSAAHAFVGDLRVQLIAPNNTTFNLFETTGASDGNGGSRANLLSSNTYVFSDATLINWWTAAGLLNTDIPGTTARTVVWRPRQLHSPTSSIKAIFLVQPSQ
jgi:hypothetical protein